MNYKNPLFLGENFLTLHFLSSFNFCSTFLAKTKKSKISFLFFRIGNYLPNIWKLSIDWSRGWMLQHESQTRNCAALSMSPQLEHKLFPGKSKLQLKEVQRICWIEWKWRWEVTSGGLKLWSEFLVDYSYMLAVTLVLFVFWESEREKWELKGIGKLHYLTPKYCRMAINPKLDPKW